jgi:hypothetical protein
MNILRLPRMGGLHCDAKQPLHNATSGKRYALSYREPTLAMQPMEIAE